MFKKFSRNQKILVVTVAVCAIGPLSAYLALFRSNTSDGQKNMNARGGTQSIAETGGIIAVGNDNHIQKGSDNKTQSPHADANEGNSNIGGTQMVASSGGIIVPGSQNTINIGTSTPGFFLSNPQFGSTMVLNVPDIARIADPANKICIAVKGTSVSILKTKQDPSLPIVWEKVRLQDGEFKDSEGWVSSSNIEKR